MKANINNAEYFGDDPSLAEPHFDDEETLLTARPVVPLNEIRAAARFGKHRTLGIAIFCSLVVGYLSASFVYKNRNQKTADEIVSSAVPGAAGNSNDGAATPTTPESDLNAGVASVPQAESSPAQADSQSAISAKVLAKNQPLAKRPSLAKPRRSAPIAERPNRQAREVQHAADDRKRTSEDAWRIREIFEGSRRP